VCFFLKYVVDVQPHDKINASIITLEFIFQERTTSFGRGCSVRARVRVVALALVFVFRCSGVVFVGVGVF
jgi:hypothetical protein